MCPLEYRFHFAQQVGVGKHHALGIGSSAGGVEQGGDHIRLDGGGHEAVWTCGKNAFKIAHGQCGLGRIRLLSVALGRIDECNLDRQRRRSPPLRLRDV